MKISIITPSLNQAEFIQRTIDSVAGQSGDFDLEHIIIDGGSTDGTVDILRESSRQCEQRQTGRGARSFRMTWVSERDQGQADAINKGLVKAGGEILAFLNSDDTYCQGALARIDAFFRDHPDQSFVTGRCRIIDPSDREIRKTVTWYKNLQLQRPSLVKLLMENFVSQPASFWRRRLMTEVGQFDAGLRYTMDYDFWCRIASRHRINVVPEYLANFRLYPSSKSGGQFRRQFREQRMVAERYLTGRRWLRAAHILNNWKICAVYELLRAFGR